MAEVYSDVIPQLLKHYGIEFTHDGTDAEFLCPFHQENTPSCRMAFETGLWFCFGCGAKGNIHQFVGRMEQDEMEAFQLISRLTRGHLVTGEQAAKIVAAREEREPFDYVQAFARFRKIDWALIPKRHAAYEYFVRRRGLSPFTLTAFDARLTGDDDYPVAIPIMRAGEMMGYAKRYVGEDPERKRYLYNRDFPGKEAMAYHRVGQNGAALVVEGMMDYLKAAQFGARHAVAILSWMIKAQQVEFLRRQGVEEIVCALDDDEAGRRGLERLAEFFRVRRFVYPGLGAKDIGDLGVNEFWYGYENAEYVEEIANAKETSRNA